MKKFFIYLIITIFTLITIFFNSCQKETFVRNVSLNEISFDKSILSLEIGNTETLIIVIEPDNITNKKTIWTSSDVAVATVSDNGTVTAVSKGNATITVTVISEDITKTANCRIFVSPPGSLHIVQWCDPQLGWYYVDYQTNIAQSEKAVQLINEIAPDVLLIAGDMVHYPDKDKHINKILEIISHVNVPILFTPGNHDLPNPVTIDGLQRYRYFFGDDLQTMESKGYSIISANSQVLYYPEEVPSEEYNQHYTKVNATLKNAKSKNQPIIVMTHIPPIDIPLVSYREEIFKLFIENGTFLWLAGHWHTPYQRKYDYPFGSIDILIGESTSVNEGNNPLSLGIRLLTVYPDNSFDWEFIPLYSIL